MHVPARIRLTAMGLERANREALRRIEQNAAEGRSHRYGAKDNAIHYQGCRGELATAVYLGLPWHDGVGDHKARDVGGFVEVRCTGLIGGRLIVHPGDVEEVPFVHASSPGGQDAQGVILWGWALAEELKRPEFWDDPQGGRPAYFAPRWALHPMPGLFPWLGLDRETPHA